MGCPTKPLKKLKWMISGFDLLNNEHDNSSLNLLPIGAHGKSNHLDDPYRRWFSSYKCYKFRIWTLRNFFGLQWFFSKHQNRNFGSFGKNITLHKTLQSWVSNSLPGYLTLERFMQGEILSHWPKIARALRLSPKYFSKIMETWTKKNSLGLVNTLTELAQVYKNVFGRGQT